MSNNTPKVFLLFFFFVFTTGIFAQTEKLEHSFYYSSGVGVGNFVGGSVNLNYLNNEKYSLMLGYSLYSRKAASRPSDYKDGLIPTLLTFGLSGPRDFVQTFTLAGGYVYDLNSKGSTRLHLRAGIGFTIIEYPHNWEPSEHGGLGNNYSFDYKKTSTPSLVIAPEIEFPFTRYFGLSIAPFLQLNKEMSVAGIEFKYMLGLLRRSNRPVVEEIK